MLNIWIIIGFILLGLTTGAAAFAAGILYGRISMLGKMTVESKRREARAARELGIWQTKLIERAGLGPLVAKTLTGAAEPAKPSRNIESPAQAITRTKQEHEQGRPAAVRIPKMPEVPDRIGKDFLKQAASAQPPAI